jgi:phosphatidylglycerol---prolipoprotein diacylglyceryl transferase
MHPELFTIPFTSLTVKSYGAMLVIGFLAAVWVIGRLTRDFTPRRDLVINAGLYALIAGLVGSRVFYVLHHFSEFRDNWLSVFAIWKGGLELLGGGLPAMLVILIYLRFYKLPARKYMDAVAIGLLVALAFGRIGCFLNGCCYGKPANVSWSVKFPYASLAYYSQIMPDAARGRTQPYTKLPDEYWCEVDGKQYLKGLAELSPIERQAVTTGPYKCLAVHPTQLYESAGAAILAILLYLYWRWGELVARSRQRKWYYPRQGYVFAFMLILYGAMRFGNEMLRDDNPFEFDGLTISQSLGIAMAVAGVIVLVVCQRMKPVGGFIETAKAKGRK